MILLGLLLFSLSKAANCMLCQNQTITLHGTGPDILSDLIEEMQKSLESSRVEYDTIGNKEFYDFKFLFQQDSFERRANDLLLTSPVNVIFNLPNIRETLNIDLKTISQIYEGIITRWNDNRIERLNPSLRLPSDLIIRIVRGDLSRDTEAFSAALGRSNRFWREQYGSSFQNVSQWDFDSRGLRWLAGRSAVGISGLVHSVPYSIGYTSQLTNNEITTVRLPNNQQISHKIIFRVEPQNCCKLTVLWQIYRSLDADTLEKCGLVLSDESLTTYLKRLNNTLNEKCPQFDHDVQTESSETGRGTFGLISMILLSITWTIALILLILFAYHQYRGYIEYRDRNVIDAVVIGEIKVYKDRPSILDAKQLKTGDLLHLVETNMRHPSEWSMKSFDDVSSIVVKVKRQTHLSYLLGITVHENTVYCVEAMANRHKEPLHATLQQSKINVNLETKYIWLLQMISALQYLHDHDITHGLLNCFCVHIDDFWQAVVCGWSRTAFVEAPLSGEITRLHFRTDDEARSALRCVDPRSTKMEKADTAADVWSLGMLVVEMFSVCAQEHLKNKEQMSLDSIPNNIDLELPRKLSILCFNMAGVPENRPTMKSLARKIEQMADLKKDTSVMEFALDKMNNRVEAIGHTLEHQATATALMNSARSARSQNPSRQPSPKGLHANGGLSSPCPSGSVDELKSQMLNPVTKLLRSRKIMPAMSLDEDFMPSQSTQTSPAKFQARNSTVKSETQTQISEQDLPRNAVYHDNAAVLAIHFDNLLSTQSNDSELVCFIDSVKEMVLQACKEYGAQTVDSGDNHFIVFTRPQPDYQHVFRLCVLAFACRKNYLELCKDGAQSRRKIGLKFGIHIDDVMEIDHSISDSHLFGDCVTTANRLAAESQNMQVLVSAKVRDLLYRFHKNKFSVQHRVQRHDQNQHQQTFWLSTTSAVLEQLDINELANNSDSTSHK